MARFRVYIKTFESVGVYESDFIEVTNDVIKLSPITQSLDNSEYDVGIFKNDSFKLVIRNDHGRYSGPEVLTTIFKYKRAESIVKVTYDQADFEPIAGFFTGGTLLSNEVTIFEGLLQELPSTSPIIEQVIDFTVLGFESLFEKENFPTFTPGDGLNANISDAIYLALNQTSITNLLTVDAGNINVGADNTTDTWDPFINKSVKKCLTDFLFLTNSVLYINNRTVYVTSREESASFQYYFYGMASKNGRENILDIQKYRDGLNRTFNYWIWPDSDNNLFARDVTSIERYGILRKEISSPVINLDSDSKIQAILNTNRTEFAFPKVEFDLVTPINYETLALYFLDKVSIDHPTISEAVDGGILPVYGIDTYDGVAKYPYPLWSIIIDPVDGFKILSRKIDPVKHTIIFGLRKV